MTLRTESLDRKKSSLGDLNFKKEVPPFATLAIDTSWMTRAQKKFFEILKCEENRKKKYDEINKLAGYKSNETWYKATRDERFVTLLKSIGVPLRKLNPDYPRHHQVKYIKSLEEREEYLKQDVWDMRKLFKVYPKHAAPKRYILKFSLIKSNSFRELVKKYFCNLLGNWKPATFVNRIKEIAPLLNFLHEKFPNIRTFGDLNRHEHIEKVLPNVYSLSDYQARATIIINRAMFRYMYQNKWKEGPKTEGLLISYDTPKKEVSLPKPIPPQIKIQLDTYLENTIISLLEVNEETPIIDPKYWDLILILRHTGRRFEDIAHLISDGSEMDCLKYDLDGDPQLYVDHRIAKISTDLIIPLAHIKDSEGNNIVEKAILRQKNRVKDLPATSDNKKYLFREIIDYDEENNPITETVSYNSIYQNALPKIADYIPLLELEGASVKTYKITPHQFRHTVATEMIDAGVDIYAVKNFLGHSSIAMTEKYIKVYQQRLKKEFKEKLMKSDATYIKNNLPVQEEIFGDNKWVKNKIIAVFDQGDGCCEHPYKMPSCPHQVACKTCIKKKIFPRHKNAVIDTIDAFTTHLNQAKAIGLSEKVEEFDKVVSFYQSALEIINKGEVFDASKHFYKDGVNLW